MEMMFVFGVLVGLGLGGVAIYLITHRLRGEDLFEGWPEPIEGQNEKVIPFRQQSPAPKAVTKLTNRERTITL